MWWEVVVALEENKEPISSDLIVSLLKSLTTFDSTVGEIQIKVALT